MIRRLLFFLYLLGPRFDGTLLRNAWYNSRWATDDVGLVPHAVRDLWLDALRTIL